MRPYRPRISILTALLLMTIVGMAIVVAQLWREVGPLRAEVRQLRIESGRLTIDDPDKIHAMAVHSADTESKSWKWRVYLPPGHKYYLHSLSAKIDDRGGAKDGGSSSTSTGIESGEQIIQVAIRKGIDGNWTVNKSLEHVSSAGGLSNRITSSMSVSGAKNWMESHGGTSTSGLLAQSQKTLEPDKPLELVRMRGTVFTPTYPGTTDPLKKNAGTSTTPTEPSDGVLIWIDENP